jgi:flavin reductase (DIM6/NTAB) family NADH-FMN oxidoreductase RutF
LQFDFATMPAKERYKLLTALVIPRPIALVTSLSLEGVLNAAPYSFFNVFSQEPPLVVLGIEHKAPRSQKDTARNIAETREFVVNLVDDELADAMNLCAIDFPPEISELDAAGLTTAASATVAAPGLVQAPAALECRLFVSLNPGHGRELIIGEVLAVQAREGLIAPSSLRVDPQLYRPIGRLYGNLYCRTADRFELRRQSFAEWEAEQGRS